MLCYQYEALQILASHVCGGLFEFMEHTPNPKCTQMYNYHPDIDLPFSKVVNPLCSTCWHDMDQDIPILTPSEVWRKHCHNIKTSLHQQVRNSI